MPAHDDDDLTPEQAVLALLMSTVGDAPDLPSLADLLRRPAWQRDAACRGAGSAPWFPQRGHDARPALAVCATCPVRPECEQFARSTHKRAGIWGGQTTGVRTRGRRPAA